MSNNIIQAEADTMQFAAFSNGTVMKLSDSADFKDPVKTENTPTMYDWAPWGSSDKDPITWVELMRKCGVLTAGIEGKARIAVGKGMQPVFINGIDKEGREELEFLNDIDIARWMEDNQAFRQNIAAVRSLLGWGWVHMRIRLDNEGKHIARFKVDDPVKCRMGRKNKATGKIEYTYYSPNFGTGVSIDKKDTSAIKKIPLLDEGEELDHLQQLIEDGTKIREFSIIYRGQLDGQEYYPYPAWYPAKQWVEMAGKIPEMKVAMMNNEITIKYIISISPKYFELTDPKYISYSKEKKSEAFVSKAHEISDILSGTSGSHKSIVNASYYNPVTSKEEETIKITAVDDKLKDGKLLVESSAGNKEILFALMINPAILGANTFGGMDGGAGSGSDIREAYLVQIMLMEAERQMNSQIFNLVKHINGWAAKYPDNNLQFRYPNSVLTTLDTGGSTKPAV
jgi:hypothetical protein